jgi:hypothetical protein
MVGYTKGSDAMNIDLRNIVKLGLPAVLLFAAGATQASNYVKVDSKNNVTNFYGVPINLTVSGLKKLPFHKKRRFDTGEGSREPYYTINARNGVEVKVKFDGNRLYLAETISRNAVGPKNIGVGSYLSDVKTAWPMGKLLYGAEDGRFATYTTGTNILYLFDPNDLPSRAFEVPRQDIEIPNIRVQKIRILPPRNPIP